VIEIASTSNFKHDFVTKLMLYQIAGVKEYWIVDPQEEMVYVHNFENTKKSRSYTFEESVICNTLQGLEIHISV
jgi:Uma2 family endonuclease